MPCFKPKKKKKKDRPIKIIAAAVQYNATFKPKTDSKMLSSDGEKVILFKKYL